MAAEDEQILAARTPVALAAASYHLQVADGAVVDQPLDVVLVGVRAVMCDGDPRAGPVACRQHRVGRGRRGRERLLAQDAPGAGLGGRDDHLLVAVGPPGAHGHEVEALLVQHLAVVGVEGTGPGALAHGAAPDGVIVGERHYLDSRHADEGDVETVPVVAPTRPPDYASTVACHSL